MNQITAQLFEAQLHDMRAELLDRLHIQRGGVRGRAEAAHEAREHLDATHLRPDEGFDMEVALEEHEAADLMAIDKALQRMEAGQYGHCIDCAQRIVDARLQAQPTALRCLDCQTRFESA
ncbi:MAG: TraR/DksA family transcriptional regulator [Hydrogenophaga sp.]|jgi:DnaK suppressor protein|uniref:TraR/DksA family transcriptional regulator n=1 Tax=Hydrogenophaga sp. TaxID=1904254 RepID=UPI001DCA3A52|nr:TraR/DksA family transcriptional regulator [Hydrogenophaga sp.]MBW0168590.1 TraR/DksA family transcriptional regulator [Hydrogenophaga sp.]MBW0183822.1 TraR/DksA family transcriptional regulator [Hydrogenophaga sp.]